MERKEVYMSFKSARINAGISLNAAAEALEISRTSIWLWETGKGMPLAEKLLRMAKLYGCSVDDLLRRED
jgi:transcriptional regulator with XRE-family HTH domain